MHAPPQCIRDILYLCIIDCIVCGKRGKVKRGEVKKASKMGEASIFTEKEKEYDGSNPKIFPFHHSAKLSLKGLSSLKSVFPQSASVP